MLTQKQDEAAKVISHAYRHHLKDRLPEELKIQDITTGQSNIIDAIPQLIEQGIIPHMRLDNLYVKDVTQDVTGQAKQLIILIGYKNAEEKPRIVYVLKGLDKDHAKEEFKGIQNAYRFLRQGHMETFTSKEKYRLKFAWHERSFRDSTTGKVYELLHAAQGRILSSYLGAVFENNFQTWVLKNRSGQDEEIEQIEKSADQTGRALAKEDRELRKKI